MALAPSGPNVYPAAGPTVSGELITVNAFLQSPLRVQKVLVDLTTQRFIADQMFSPGGQATGGAVIFDQVMTNSLFTQRDVQAIAPGSEFPILTDVNEVPLVARTTKWGGAFIITYEERDRDRRDIVQRELTKLRNTIVRKVDSVAVAVVRAAPINSIAVSTGWATSTTIVKDLATALTTVDKLDMGYEITDALISPTTELNMVTNSALLTAIEQSRRAVPSPLASNRLTGLLGLNWYVSNRVLDTEVILLSGRIAGNISDEKPLYSRVVDQPEMERVLIQAARLTVPYVTDPKSIVRLTGV